MDNNGNIPPPNNNASWGQPPYNNVPAFNGQEPPLYYTIEHLLSGNAGAAFPNAATIGMPGADFSSYGNNYAHPLPAFSQFIPDFNAWLHQFAAFPAIFIYYVPAGPNNPLPYIYSVAAPGHMPYMPDGMPNNAGPPTNVFTDMSYPLPSDYGYDPHNGWGAFRETAPPNRGRTSPPHDSWIPPEYRRQATPKDRKKSGRKSNTTQAVQCSASTPDGASNMDTHRCMLARRLSTEIDQAVATSSQSPIDNPSVTEPQKPYCIVLSQIPNDFAAATNNDDSSVAPSIPRRSRPARRAVLGDIIKNSSEIAPDTTDHNLPYLIRNAAGFNAEAARNPINRARSVSPCNKNQVSTIAANQGKRSKSAAFSEDKIPKDAAVAAAGGLKRSKSVDSLNEESGNSDISVRDVPFCFTARHEVNLRNPSPPNNAQTSRAVFRCFNGGQSNGRQKIAKKVSKHALLNSPMLSKAAPHNEKGLVNNTVETDLSASNVEPQNVGNPTSNTSVTDSAFVDFFAASASTDADASVLPTPPYNFFTTVEYNGADLDGLNGNTVPSIPMRPTHFAGKRFNYDSDNLSDDTTVSKVEKQNDMEPIASISTVGTASPARVSSPQPYSLFMGDHWAGLTDLNGEGVPPVPKRPEYFAATCANCDAENPEENTTASKVESQNEIEPVASTSAADASLDGTSPISHLFQNIELNQAIYNDEDGGSVPGNCCSDDDEYGPVDYYYDNDDEVLFAMFEGHEDELYIGLQLETFKYLLEDDDM